MQIDKKNIGLGCGALIVNKNDEFLLLKRGNSAKNDREIWSQPGGAVEFGEKVCDAIKR